MAWGKSVEEKEMEKHEKQKMRLQEQKEKEQAKLQQFMDKFNLHGLDNRDIESLRAIVLDETSNSFFEAAMFFSLSTKAEDMATINLLKALMQQNWIMIRQLSRIGQAIEALGTEKPAAG